MRTSLTIPDELAVWFKKEAASNHRSLNNQILVAMEAYLLASGRRKLGKEHPLAQVAEMMAFPTYVPPSTTAHQEAPDNTKVIPGLPAYATTPYQNTPLCTCGLGERASGKHNKRCPVRLAGGK